MQDLSKVEATPVRSTPPPDQTATACGDHQKRRSRGYDSAMVSAAMGTTPIVVIVASRSALIGLFVVPRKVL